MKNLILIIALLFSTHVYSVVSIFYYTGSGVLSGTANWRNKPDGTGQKPQNFVADSQYFVIRNITNISLTTAWTVSGLGSKVILGNSLLSPITLTIATGGSLTGKLDIDAAVSGSNTLVMQTSNIPTFGNLDNTSTVNYAYTGASTVQIVHYGNLIISGSRGSNTVTFPNGQVGVAGSFSNSSTFTTGGFSCTSGNTVGFDGSITQYIPGFIFNHLTLTNTGNKVATGDITVNGTLTVNNNGLVLDMATYALSFVTLASGPGTLRTQNTSSAPIPAGRSYPFKIEFNGGEQTIPEASYTDVTIGGTGNKTLGGTIVVNGEMLFESGKVILNGNVFSLNGDIAGTSNFVGSATSNMNVGGSGAFSGIINFDQTNSSTRTLNSFTLNRLSSTVKIGSLLEVVGEIHLDNGTLDANGMVKLVSNAGATATIPQITGTGAITGDVIAERYIPASARRWRFISSPITNGTLLDWKGEIYITGLSGATNGFDATQTNNPSVYTYNETTTGTSGTGWTAATNISNAITAGLGYRLFIRGDRSDPNRLTGVNNTQNEVTMNLVGTVNTGDISLPVTYTNTGSINDDGWNLVGNPYPCQYDWDAFYHAGNAGGYSGTNYSNIEPTFFIWDATSNSYKSYNAMTNSGAITNGIIATGQGFFVKANAESPFITFKEMFKSSSTPTQMFKASMNDELRIKVQLDPNDYDIFIMKFVNGSSLLNDIFDSRKMSNPDVNIASIGIDNYWHSLDARPEPTHNDTIRLNVSGISGSYQMIFSDIPRSAKYFYLEDTYLSNMIRIDQNSTYAFSIVTGTPASQGSSRFRIIVSNSGSLPVTFGKFEAAKISNLVELTWNTYNELNSSVYQVERSTNNMDYQLIGEVKAAGNSSKEINYSFVDQKPDMEHINYYRIKEVDNDGKYVYSEIRNVLMDMIANVDANHILTVIPNPAVDNILIRSNQMVDAKYEVNIYNIEGKLVKRYGSINSSDGRMELNVSELSYGTYIIKAVNANGVNLSAKFMIR